jgi:hypothetical protein
LRLDFAGLLKKFTLLMHIGNYIKQYEQSIRQRDEKGTNPIGLDNSFFADDKASLVGYKVKRVS